MIIKSELPNTHMEVIKAECRVNILVRESTGGYGQCEEASIALDRDGVQALYSILGYYMCNGEGLYEPPVKEEEE